jgi:hypothetical protein
MPITTPDSILNVKKPEVFAGTPSITPEVNPNPDPSSLQGTMSQPAPTPEAPLVDIQPQQETQPQPSPQAPSQPQMPGMSTFAGYIDIMKNKLTENNKLADARAKLVTALYDRPLNPEETASLPENIQKAIASGDKRNIEFQIRLVNDQIQGRTQSLDKSIDYLTSAYEKDVTNAQTQFEKAQQTIIDLIKANPDTAAQTFKSLYTPEQISKLKSMGLDVEGLVAGGGNIGNGMSGSGMFAPGSAAALNNPLGIKPGGKFSQYSTMEEGLQAGQNLIQRYMDGVGPLGKRITADSTIDQLVKTWITGDPNSTKATGYNGDNVAQYLRDKLGIKGVTKNTPMYQIGAANLTKALANFESPGYDRALGDVKDTELYKQYGLLAQTDFNPSNNIDSKANMYLSYYLKNAAIPTSYQLGMGRGTAASSTYSDIVARANDLFFKATGSSLPDINILKENKKLVTDNNKVLNKNEILADTINRNFDLAIKGEITNNVNKNATIVNRLLNPFYLALGNPAVNQAMISNGTISQEFANLISIRNASGTTVADKDVANELIKFGTSVEAQKAVVERLKAEAMNIHGALADQNAKLYQTIDPLQQSPQNPNRSGSTQSNLPAQVKAKGYDYNKMKSDGYSDDEIKQSLGL